MNEYRRPHSIFFPILLVTLGIFFLMANLGTIQNSAWGILETYWPLIFIIGALDGLYQRHGWVGPLVGIGLGTVLLLGNLHYLRWGSLDLLLRLWPVLLVAWGLDIAFGHDNSVWSTLVRVGLGLLLVVGIIWLSVASPFGGAVKSVAFDQALDGARQSSLNFTIAAGELTLSGGAEDATLVNGTIGLPRDMTLSPDYHAPVDGSSQLSLEGVGVVVVPFGNSVPWNLKVNSVIPITLATHVGVGNQVLDLSSTKVTEFDTQMAVGQTVVTLPKSASVTGNVQVAVGELILRVPEGSRVILHANTGATSIQLPQGYTNSNGLILSDNSNDYVIELTVDVPVGSLVVQEIK
jgi:Domain of unknown function (DUF5668)